jgi:biotin synthase
MKAEQIHSIKNEVLAGRSISYAEGVELLNSSSPEELYAAADEIREHFIGRKFDMCSIQNAKSGRCSEDCKWCSQSAHFKTGVEEYDLINPQLALDVARMNASQGINRYSLVTSGRALDDKRLDALCDIYREVKKETKLHVCASMGLLNKSQLEKLQQAGIEHYHCNLETAPSFFSKVCSTHTIKEKLQTINWAKELGIGICSGGILGMGESPEQRVELAIALQQAGADSIPVNILNPIEGTALQGAEKLTDEEVLRAIAVFRFANPKAHIRFAGGRNQLSKEAQIKALRCGVSAALVGDYLTTLGTKVAEDKEMFAAAGFSLSAD